MCDSVFPPAGGIQASYDAGPQAFELLENAARFFRDLQSEEGKWGQRYSLDGRDKSVYKQEDNLAHGISILCNNLLTAKRLGSEIDDLEEANNMARSYEDTRSKFMIPDERSREGGYIQFAMPLMWAHAEYSRALLVRSEDWWKTRDG